MENLDLLRWLIDHGGKLQLVLLFLAAATGFARVGSELRRWVRGRLHDHELSRLDAERIDGQPAALEGTLRIIADPCPRFDDGLPCAAASVSLTSPAPPGHRGPLPAHARAGKLALDAGGESVLLVGPVEVVTGSREVWPVVLPQWFPTALRDRLRKLVGLAGEQAVNFAPVYRSLGEGDRVHIRGVWERVGVEHEHYRDGAGWSLVPAAETRTLRIATHEVREVEGPHLLIKILGALAFAAMSFAAMTLLGKAAMNLSRRDFFDPRLDLQSSWSYAALVTPSRGQALEGVSNALDRRKRLDARTLDMVLAAHEARGDCLEQGKTLYAHGKRMEAVERWSRCRLPPDFAGFEVCIEDFCERPDQRRAETSARWAAVRTMYELTEWKQASDLLEELDRFFLDGRRMTLALRIHLLASHPDRASALVRWWDETERARREGGDEQENEGGFVCEISGWPQIRFDLERFFQREDETSGDGIDENELLVFHTMRTSKQLWKFALTSRGLDLGAVLLPGTVKEAQERNQRRSSTPKLSGIDAQWLAAYDESMALYESLLGHHEQARHHAKMLQGVANNFLLGSATPRDQFIRFIVETRAGNFQEAEAISQTFSGTFDAPLCQHLAAFLVGRGELDPAVIDPGISDRCGQVGEPDVARYLCSRGSDEFLALLATGDGAQVAPALGCLTSEHAHLLPLLAPRIRNHPEALLLAAQEVYREEHPRTLLDLLAEASDEVLLRQRLGLPDPQQKAQQRIERIDRALRAPGVGALVRRLEGWR